MGLFFECTDITSHQMNNPNDSLCNNINELSLSQEELVSEAEIEPLTPLEIIKQVLKSQDFFLFLISLSLLIISQAFAYSVIAFIKYKERDVSYFVYDKILTILPYYGVEKITYLILFLINATELFYILKNSRRLVIMKRYVLNIQIILIVRVFLMLLTRLPNPNPKCAFEGSKINNFFLYIYRFIFGFDICGDSIFSGPLINLLLPVLFHFYYFDKKVGYIMLANCFIGMICLLLSKTVYVIDIMLSFVLVPLFFYGYHNIADNKEDFTEIPLLFKLYFSCMEWKTKDGLYRKLSFL